MADTSISWVQLIAAFGIGTIIAAVFGWWGARAVAISNHRQNWINALRDDITEFLKHLDILRIVVPEMMRAETLERHEASNQKKDEARIGLLIAYRRTMMRLNMTEARHVKLANLLTGIVSTPLLTGAANANATVEQVNQVLEAARVVLKYEWDVAKYGMFARPIRAFKSWPPPVPSDKATDALLPRE